MYVGAFHFFEKLDLQTKCFVEKFLQVRTFDDPSVIDEKYIYFGADVVIYK